MIKLPIYSPKLLAAFLILRGGALVAQTDLVKVKNESSVNTAFQEYSPAFYQDGLVFIASNPAVATDKKEDSNTGKATTSIFFTSRNAEGVLQRPTPFAEELTTKYYDGPLSFNADGSIIYFTRSNVKKGKPIKAKDGLVKLKIYSAEKKDNKWVNIQELPFNNAEFDCAHPSVSKDGKRLYFSSNRPGGFGGMDLYVSTFINGKWSEPVNLGPKINTDKNEIFPFSNTDGKVIFASNGHEGIGNLDIFFTTKTDTGWLKPRLLPEPINSRSDDFGLIVNADKKLGFFSSNRASGNGDDDIFNIDLSNIDVESIFPKIDTHIAQEEIAATEPEPTPTETPAQPLVEEQPKTETVAAVEKPIQPIVEKVETKIEQPKTETVAAVETPIQPVVEKVETKVEQPKTETVAAVETPIQPIVEKVETKIEQPKTETVAAVETPIQPIVEKVETKIEQPKIETVAAVEKPTHTEGGKTDMVSDAIDMLKNKVNSEIKKETPSEKQPTTIADVKSTVSTDIKPVASENSVEIVSTGSEPLQEAEKNTVSKASEDISEYDFDEIPVKVNVASRLLGSDFEEHTVVITDDEVRIIPENVLPKASEKDSTVHAEVAVAASTNTPKDKSAVPSESTDKEKTKVVATPIVSQDKVQKKFLVVVGTYSHIENATIQKKKVMAQGYQETEIIQYNDTHLYGVCVKQYGDEKEAQVLARSINGKKGLQAFVKVLK